MKKKQINFRVDAELEMFWKTFDFEEWERLTFLDKLIKNSPEFNGNKPISSTFSQFTKYISAPVSAIAWKFWRDFKTVGGKSKWIRELIKKSPQFKEFKALN